MVIYNPRTIDTLPLELIEMILISHIPDDNQYILMNTCRKWYHIIHDWRTRNKKESICKTPLHVVCHSEQLLEWGLRHRCQFNAWTSANIFSFSANFFTSYTIG